MSWDSKANNQWLTKLDVSNKIGSGISAIGSAPAGKTNSQWITRTEYIAWIQTDGSITADAGWITKNSVASHTLNLPYSYTVNYLSTTHANFYDGWSTSAGACAGTGTSITVYSDYSTPTVGAVLYIYNGTYMFPFRTFNGSEWYKYSTTTFQLGAAGTPTNYTIAATAVCNYTVTYVVNNNNAASNNQAQIYKNGSLYTQTTGNPPTGISGNFSISPGDTIEVVITNSGGSGFSQSITITGGASYSSGTITDTGADSGVLTPTGDVTIDVELS